MHPNFVIGEASPESATIELVVVGDEGPDLSRLAPEMRGWAQKLASLATPGEVLLLPPADGRRNPTILFTISNQDVDPFMFGKLPTALPAGDYHFAETPPEAELTALAWALGCYRFARYRELKPLDCRLLLPSSVDAEAVCNQIDAITLARDLINMPANDLGPEQLEEAVYDVAKIFGAELEVVKGRELIHDFPMIAAVGQASDRPPRLVIMRWGRSDAPKLTLVGKGVCFDTGGLDLKPSNAMGLMKKDMGGAANCLALAQMVMRAGLDVQLTLLIPAVENSVSGSAFRPGDILQSRAGLRVEIGNTDAEGRLILADALVLADAEKPDLLINMATLTGAARVALGPDIVPFYTKSEPLAEGLMDASTKVRDPLWRMPLWQRYAGWLDSKVADINHISSGAFAGSITAALFLQHFVKDTTEFVHFDLYAWNPQTRPAHPEGGEAQGIRALFRLICDKFIPA